MAARRRAVQRIDGVSSHLATVALRVYHTEGMESSANDPRAIIDAILNDLDSLIGSREVVAYMTQALYQGHSMDDALDACFRAPGPIEANARQAADFRVAAQRLWSELQQTYDRSADEPFALLRDKLLKLLQRQTDWVSSLDSRGIHPTELPREKMARIGQLGGMLSASLELLGAEEDSDRTEIEAMAQSLDQAFEVTEAIISQVEESLADAASLDPSLEEPTGYSTERQYRDPTEANATRPIDAESVFVLKIALRGIRPPIWRRVRVPGNRTLFDLHRIIQDSMGWDDYHLHEFNIAGRCFMDSDMVDDMEDCIDENETTLDSLPLREKQRFVYTYDFGDGWEHTVFVERMIPATELGPEQRESVQCLAGKRACPVEDCGGPDGYLELLELMQAPPEELNEFEREFIERAGEGFDPERVDLQRINAILASC